MNTAVLKPLLLTGVLLMAAPGLSPLASAELELGGTGAANTIQAKFEAFTACNQKARDQGLGDSACDKEALDLRNMIGGGSQAASSDNSGEARIYRADLKQTDKK